MEGGPKVSRLGGRRVEEAFPAGPHICAVVRSDPGHSQYSAEYFPAVGIAQLRYLRAGMGIVGVGLDQGRTRQRDNRVRDHLDSVRGLARKPAALVVLFLAGVAAAGI